MYYAIDIGSFFDLLGFFLGMISGCPLNVDIPSLFIVREPPHKI
jgi:hypothetical protein